MPGKKVSNCFVLSAKPKDGTSVSITSTEVKYATSAAYVQPASIAERLWSVSYPSSLTEGTWLHSRTKVTYSDGNTTTTYTSSRVGANGAAGYNTAPVFLYKRSDTALSSVGFTDTLTYTFTTRQLSSTPNGWSQAIPPNDGNPLYVTVATAFANTATDTIAYNEWSTPVVLAESGAHGLNTAPVFLYRRYASLPTKPTVPLTYTFATGLLSGGSLNNWSQTIPASDGHPCWVIQATASGAGATDTIETSEWSSQRKLVEDGTNGTDGAGTERVYIRTKQDTAPYVNDDEDPTGGGDSNGKYSGDDGYLPSVGVNSGKVETNGWESRPWGEVMGEIEEYGECVPAAKGVSQTWPYEWVLERRLGNPNAQGKRSWNDYSGPMSLHTKLAGDAETYEIVFTEAWAMVSASDEITARLRGYAYKVKGSTRTLLTGVTIRYGYIIDDSDTYSHTTTNNSGYFSESGWFDGDEIGPEGYNKGSKTVFAAIVIGGAVVRVEHVLMIKEAQQGQQGSTGKMCPIVGPYDPNAVYTSNSLQTVAVEVENTTTHKTELWYLTAATNVVNGVHIAPIDSNQSVWSKGLNEYNLIRAKYLFADFAQLGSFVVSQDFFLSQYGTLFGFGGAVGETGSRTAGKVYMKTVDGKNVPYYAIGSNSGDDRPCYTFFDASDPMAENVQNGPSFTLEGNGIAGLVRVRRVWFTASADTTVNITVSPSSEANYDWGAVGLLDSTALSADGVTAATVKNGNTATLVKASGTTPQTTTVSVAAGTHFIEIAYLKDASANSYNDNAVFTFSESGNSCIAGFSMIMFRPMKVVNALTSEEWMAGGKVHVSKGGDVVMSDIYVNNATIEGSLMYHKVYVDKAGNYIRPFTFLNANGVGIDIDGSTTVKKITLHYDTIIISGSKRSSAYNLFTGIVCTGYTVILPPARFFVGMCIKIINGTISGSNGTGASRAPSPINLAVIYRADTEEYKDLVDLSYTANMIVAAIPMTFSKGGNSFTFIGSPDSTKCEDLTPTTADNFTVFGLIGDSDTLYRSIELVAQKNPYISTYNANQNGQDASDYAWMIIDAQQ